jgi:ATP-dependent exoDNAse (exonuclease V) beta subunit
MTDLAPATLFPVELAPDGLGPNDLKDHAARDEALDTGRSILVQAPAGSGKTELLTKRFLKLLAIVEEPEQILAITFTRPAAAEMRHRVLKRLEEARAASPAGRANGSIEEDSARFAREALENSDRRGWRLLEQPQRLNIQTIDSLCLRIAHQMPLSARASGTLQPTENPDPLYQRAARKTIEHLGEENEDLNEAIRALLQLRDGRLANVEDLLAQMLRTRDQWARSFPLSGEVDWEATRARLEAPFEREIARVLAELYSLLEPHPEAVQELLALAHYACGNLDSEAPLQRLAGLTGLPPAAAEFVEHWDCIRKLLLTGDDEARKSYNKNHGFPPKDNGEKRRLLNLVERTGNVPGFFALLAGIRHLPPPRYSEDQWRHLRHIFVALRQAVAELDQVFAEEGRIDFVEASGAAVQVLAGNAAHGASAEGDAPLRHLLVDEFQDTSRRQIELISALLHDWKEGDGRTFFLVGDPMQSIYMFRQAEVELFDLVAKHGLAAGGTMLPVKTLRLTTNFRSNAGVVHPLNEVFATVFPYAVKPGSAAVDFLPGNPHNPVTPPGAYQVHASFIEAQDGAVQVPSTPGRASTPVEIANQREAEEIAAIVQQYLPRIAAARLENREFTVAVLGRARSHINRIAAALRDAEVPFRAVELESLGERQEILDLQSLTRALLHPLDRIAWLAILRAPWCGLELRDLHLLLGNDDGKSAHGPVLGQVDERAHLLGDASKRRVERVLSVLRVALRHRYSYSFFSSWIERTWLSLGGPDCVDAAGYENALAYFRMLEKIASDGIAASGSAMKEQLDRLFGSPDPAVSERCGVQLMTMHKAKGLGFNVVILPGLNRPSGRDVPALIQYLERETDFGPELLAAPIGGTGEDTSQLNRWIRGQRQIREIEERKRLLYVACTRAREELHLFATLDVPRNGVVPREGTLLRTAWPALEEVFRARHTEHLAAATAAGAGNLVAFPVAADGPHSGVVDKIAAQTSRTRLNRLPADWIASPIAPDVHWERRAPANGEAGQGAATERPYASRTSRLRGTAIHALLERTVRLFEQGATIEEVRASAPQLRRLAEAIARNHGLSPQEIESSSSTAVEALEKVLGDPHGVWILKARAGAQTESSWTGLLNGASRELRIDRSFRAGLDPLTEGSDSLWIIDYKTATHSQSGLEEFLVREREQYAPQLERYAAIMRQVHGPDLQLRLGLYYPLMPRLLWWAPQT